MPKVEDTRDYKDEDGKQLLCSDCQRPAYYDFEDEDYHHVNPAHECYLIPVEDHV